MNHLIVIQFRSSLSLFRNLSTNFIVVVLNNSTTFARFCTICYNICMFIWASCIVNRNQFASSLVISFNSIAFFILSFNDSRSKAILSLSKFNCSITVLKLISRPKKSCSFRQSKLGNEKYTYYSSSSLFEHSTLGSVA